MVGRGISGYADLCRFSAQIAPLPASITVNATGMQTEQIFRVSIRADEMLFSVAAFMIKADEAGLL